jgi:hypothetical protein
MGQIENIGHRIVAFLEAAVADCQADRNISAAEAILGELLAQLPENDPEWTQALARVAATIAHALQDRPHDWPQAITLVGIYFDDAWIPETSPHQRAQRNMRRRRAEIDYYPVPIRLASPLIECLLANATSSQRIAFLTAIDSWDVLQALARVLPELDLDAAELAHFLAHIEPFTSRDLARGEILQAVRKWAGRHTVAAKEVVDTWLLQESSPHLAPSSIQILVEGVMAASPSEQVWRDDVITHLMERHDEEAWRLAAFLECFAWPHDIYERVETRHVKLVEHVKRSPTSQISMGLRAMRREAARFPHASVGTALKIWQLWPACYRDQQAKADAAMLLADVGAAAARTLMTSPHSQTGTRAGTDIDWQAVLSVMESLISLDRVPPLDNLLALLTKIHIGLVEAFMCRWMQAHLREVREDPRELKSMFPLLAHALGRDDLVRLLLSLALHRNQSLRAVAVQLLARSAQDRHYNDVVADSCQGRSDSDICGFIYEAIGCDVLGSFWVPLLFTLARLRTARPEPLTKLHKLMVHEATSNYPGLCRRELADWKAFLDSTQALEVPSQERQALEAIGADITRTLQAQESIYSQKQEIPELRALCPSASEWHEVRKRWMKMAQARGQRSGEPSLASLLPQVPIARGGASVHDEVERPFVTISASVELPIRDTLDPVAAALARLEYRRRAAELLGNEPEATG